MSPDRGHIHHRLVDMGFSQKQSVFILYAMSGVLGLTAVVLAESGAMRALLLLIGVLIVIFTGSLFTKNRRAGNKQPMPEETITVTLDKIDKTDKNEKQNQ